MSSLPDSRTRMVENTPEIAISPARQCCCYPLSSLKVSMLLGLSDQGGVHNLYNTIHNASVRHLASIGGPHSACDYIIEASHF